MCAYREDGWVTITWFEGGEPQTYFLEGDTNPNADQERTLTAKVEVETWYIVDGIEIDKKTGKEISLGAVARTEVSAGVFNAAVEIHGEYTWTRSDGKKFKAETKVARKILVKPDPTGQYRDIDTYFCSNGANLDFQFQDHSGGNSVAWSPPDSDPDSGSGSN